MDLSNPDVPTNLNPYQGLKLPLDLSNVQINSVPTNLNPYQGLKRAAGYQKILVCTFRRT